MRQRLFRQLLALTFILAASAAAIAQSKADAIDEMMKKYHEYGQFNGAVLVAQDGKVIYEKGLGMANMEWGIPIKADTKFRIGSVTKQFTAVLIMQLVEEGKVKLDGKLSDYLPDYRKDTGEKVTIHQLLNHTSGIPSYTSLAGFFQNESRDPYKPDEFVEKFCSGDLEFEPGSKYSYNNSGYFILGVIVEKLTGKDYATALKERILDKVGMDDTGYDTHAPILKNRAQGYQKTPDGYVNAPYLDMSLPYAAGSMYSTVKDLLKWDQALYTEKVLSNESKEKMFTPGLSDYGYGFSIREQEIGDPKKKIKLISHGGGINGFNCLFTRNVTDKQVVIVLDNVGQGRYHGAITRSISSILYGQPFDNPKKSIRESISKTAMNEGGEAAVALYRKLKAADPDKYDFSENELNVLGYELMREKGPEEALPIFKLNVEMFPRASNPYDSLGEAYLNAGNKELALKNYKKSVELNPDNTGGIAAINKIEGNTPEVDPAVYDSYAGDYELMPNLVLTVSRDGDKLMGQATGQPKVELEPVSGPKFRVAAVNADVTFETGADGKVTGLTLLQGGREIKAKKIK